MGNAEPILSSGNALYVRLISSRGRRGHRFRASWSTVCHKNLTEPTGIIQSPNDFGRYLGNLDCTYVIEQKRGYTITLDFDSFSLDPAPRNRNCTDYVEVYDGSSDNFPLLGGPYCGNTFPAQLKSTGSAMFIKFHSDATTDTGSTGFHLTYVRTAPECRTWTIQPREGIIYNISAPGFPEPYPEDAECTWRVEAPRGFVIDFVFHAVELGADTEQNVDCSSPAVRTEVGLYDGSGNSLALLAKYCKRGVFPHMVTTTSQHLTVIFKVKNMQKYRYWDQHPIHGFRASFSIKRFNVFDQNSGTVELLGFGPYTSDSVLTPRRPLVVRVDSGIPIGNQRLRYVYIYRDGKVAFSDIENDNNLITQPVNQNSCRKRISQDVCAYCAKISDSFSSESLVYYRLHQRGNSTSEKRIFPIAHEKVRRFKGSDDFNASVALVVTWYRVRCNLGRCTGNATFQTSIVASDTEAYSVVLYQPKSMRWSLQFGQEPIIDAGFTSLENGVPKCNDLIYSRTQDVLNMDDVLGNIGLRGAWVYKLGEVPANPSQACDDWYHKNDGPVHDHRSKGFAQLPKCPCKENVPRQNMIALGIWILANERRDSKGNSMTCYRLSRSAGSKHWPYGKECCYYNHNLVQTKPDAASVTAYNPSFSDLYHDYVREDKLAHDACCYKSNSSKQCDMFYELRPIGDCESSSVFTQSWLCCDPHILTMDGEDYTFNGWGEYIMINARTSDADFTLQARTDLTVTDTGTLSNATVFTAFGAYESGVTVFIGLDPGDRTTLIVYANNEDFSRRFENDPKFLVNEEEFLLQRINNSAAVAFPSGISFQVSVRMKSLALSVSLPNTFRNITEGLLGNFNGIKEDDFVLPDGTVMTPRPTERQIFEDFGPFWAVTEDDTVMLYGPREGPSTYAHPEFVPVFFDEQTEETKRNAEAVCGQNVACLYDYVATGSRAFALDSKAAKEEADESNELLKNAVPTLRAPSTIRVTSGVSTTFTLIGSDLDGDSITYHAVNDNQQDVQLNSMTGAVSYLPDVNEPVDLSFFVMDSHNVTSPVTSVQVIVCSGCSGHGTCENSTFAEPQADTFTQNFQRALCVCEPAWVGQDCQLDFDGCAVEPCLSGQTCRDLTPQEQGSSNIGFDCGPCPAGYTNQPGAPVCVDINECENDALNLCQATCINTEGSYKCGCKSGYRLNSDGRTCRDVDECQEMTHNCEQICNNFIGGYDCSCEDGYSLEENGNTCKQNDSLAKECAESGCSQGCKHGNDPSSGAEVLECFCFSGYDQDPDDETVCRDHDECQGNVTCSQGCFNYDGGYMCTCYTGYQLADDNATCLPCPKLSYGPNCQYHCSCSGHATGCHHVTGCVCQAGWKGPQCQEDIDECTETPDACLSGQLCVNSPGSYRCKCPPGYNKNEDGTCTDIDECSEDSLLNTCGALERCFNVPGSFYCTCLAGYTKTGGSCIDIDECATNTSECEHECINVKGSYNCECFYGYRLNKDRVTCSQVTDVCASEEGLSCAHGCTLNDGGRAACFCRVGYKLGADMQSCDKSANCSTFKCSHTCAMNSNGEPVCSCPVGTILDNDFRTCRECPSGTYGRDCAQTCACGLGATRCDATGGCVCQTGWTGEKCDSDVNECDVTSVQQICQDKQATCFNTRGSYRCQCAQGYQMSDGGVCVDINECIENPCGQQCENSPGSYRCICNKGFTWDETTRSCKDLDECALSATHKCTQSCINTPGSYLCACDRPGFTLTPDGTTCIGTGACNRTDCPTENGGCSEERCFCNSGYTLTNSSTCEPVDTDWCALAKCEYKCEETSDGSFFNCKCPDGFVLNNDMRTCRSCPLGTYGSQCSQQCACSVEHTESCDAVIGKCSCKEGWEGSTCSDENGDSSPTTCQSLAQTSPCPEGERCVEENGKPVCKQVSDNGEDEKDTGSSSSSMATTVGVAVGMSVVAALSVAGAVFIVKKLGLVSSAVGHSAHAAMESNTVTGKGEPTAPNQGIQRPDYVKNAF